MDFLWSVLRDYFITIITSICFLVFLKENELTSRRTMNLFRLATICIILVMICEIAGRYLSMLDHPTTLRVLCSVVSYAVRPAIPYFIALIPMRYEEEIMCAIAAMPLLINAVFLSTAFYSNVVFSYDESNTFIRGPLGAVPFIIGGIYILMIIFIAFIPFRRGERDETILCVIMSLSCSACVVMETFEEKSGLLLLACIISEIFYYVYFIVNHYRHEPLTDALFGKQLYQDIEKIRIPCAFILVDINGLKKLNKMQGHDVGDEALKVFGRAVNLSIPPTARFYRIGGDEFAIIYKGADQIQVSSLVARIREKSEKLPYGFSFGYAFLHDSNDFSNAYAAADAMLRENKDSYWKRHASENVSGGGTA